MFLLKRHTHHMHVNVHDSILTFLPEGLMTLSLMVVPISEALSPTLLAQVLAAVVKLDHPEERDPQGSFSSSLSRC